MSKNDKITAELMALGFALECGSPRGQVDDKKKEAWPHVACDVKLTFAGREVWAGPYKMGVGNFSPDRLKSVPPWLAASTLFGAWKKNPHANFKDKATWALVAADIAKAAKITPSLPDVLSCLLMDGEAYFDAASFEDWAQEFGYDPDSRKAEAIWKTCDETGRALARGVPADKLAKARELLADW